MFEKTVKSAHDEICVGILPAVRPFDLPSELFRGHRILDLDPICLNALRRLLPEVDVVVMTANDAGIHLVPITMLIYEVQSFDVNLPVVLVAGGLDSETFRILLANGLHDVVDEKAADRELLPRVLARARRPRNGFSVGHRLGNLWVDPKCFRALLGEVDPGFTALEYRLLDFFLQASDRVVRRSEILKALWPTTHVSERTVDVHVSALRKKLKGWTHQISALYGAGYGIRPVPKAHSAADIIAGSNSDESLTAATASTGFRAGP